MCNIKEIILIFLQNTLTIYIFQTISFEKIDFKVKITIIFIGFLIKLKHSFILRTRILAWVANGDGRSRPSVGTKYGQEFLPLFVVEIRKH